MMTRCQIKRLQSEFSRFTYLGNHGVVRSPLYTPGRLLRISSLLLLFAMAWLGFDGRALAQDNLFPDVPADTTDEEPEDASDLHSLYYSAHLPTNRRLSQELRQAKQLIEAGRFSEALPMIDRILAAEEDNFDTLRDEDSPSVVRGLKNEAQQLLSSLPPAGVAALELDQGVKARRELTAAIEAGKVDELSRIARRYPQTEAAFEARLMVAQMKLDQGYYDSAAGIYQQLLDWPKAAKDYEPLLVARLTQCYAAAGNLSSLEQSVTKLRGMSSPSQRAALTRLLGTDNLDTWLEELATYSNALRERPSQQGWFVEGHDTRRNPIVGVNAVPHLWPSWEARTVKETNVADRLQSRVDWTHRHGTAWGLVSSPIAVGNYVIVRTPTNLVAIDWQTGRRVWETRPDVVDDDNAIQLQYRADGAQSVVALDATDQRLWLDAVYGAITSDGDRVYAVRNLDSINMRSQNRYRIQGLFRAGREFEDPGNTLTAFDLRSEGKRVWEINGENNKNLSGCFFLGPPLAEGNSLYVLAEFADAIHLIELDAQTGDLKWKQPLSNLERSVLFDVGRRLAGATPTLAGGMVLCPTGAGSVVAVDPIDHSLRWVFRFEVDEELADRNNANLRQSFGVYQPQLTSSWQRNRVLVSGDSVLVTAPECEQLYCLDLVSGEKRWAIDRDEFNQLVGVVDNKVILATPHELTQLKLENGKKISGRNRIKIPEGLAVAGNCLLSEGQVILPLSNHQIGIVDLNSSKISSMLVLRECESVGNLAFHRGTILSQSATTLSRFDRLDSLREQLAAAEAANQMDVDSLRIGGELAWSNNDLDRAIELLTQAYHTSPEAALVRHRLTAALVAAMREDYTRFGSYTGLLSELSTDTRQRLELYRFSTDGALAANDPTAAFGFLREIYAIDLDTMVDLGVDHQVHAERWFAERLWRVWQASDEALRQDIRDELMRLDQQAMANNTPDEWTRLVRYYGAIPAGRELRIRLAKQWSDAGRLAEAELLMLAPDAEERQAQLQVTDVLAIAAMPHSTSTEYDPHHWLGTNTPDYQEWPDGRVVTDVSSGRVSQLDQQESQIYRSTARASRTVRSAVEARSCGVEIAGPELLAISHSGVPQLLSWNPLGEIAHGVPLQMTALQNSNSATELTCIRFGHFAVLGVGEEIATVDLRPNPGDQGMMLWASDPDPRMRAQALRMIQLQNRGLIQGRFTITPNDLNPGDSNSPAGQLCHASPLGIVLRSDDQISCYSPVDGELLWVRREVPADGTCFGDSHHLLMQAEGEIEGVVISMIDGSDAGTWRAPEGKRLLTCGRNLVVSLFKQGKRHLQVVDALTEEVLVERDYPTATKITPYEGHLVATMEPESGQLEILDALAGSVLFTQTLLPERGLENIVPFHCGDLLILATNTESLTKYNNAGIAEMDNSPLITGHVYALDPSTGEARWPQPATVKGEGLWTLQPSGSPALIFLSRAADRESSGQTATTRLLCLDKRTGRSLIRNENLRAVVNEPWSVLIDHNQNPTVQIDLRQSLVSLEFTSTPRPPEPVAMADVEGVQKTLSSGLFGFWKRSLGGSSESTPQDELDSDD